MNFSKDLFKIRAYPAALSIGSCLLLAACQQGSNSPAEATAQPSIRAIGCAQVSAGFNGDINATYSTSGLDQNTCSAIAAGGGEGKVLNGQLTVIRLADGVVLGQAITDSVKGLVTVKASAADLPLLITLSGRSGAKYYDEGVDNMVDFGPGNEIHALVDKMDENIGVSPFTEAAYRYALNNFAANPKNIASGKEPLHISGKLQGLTRAQAGSANQIVLDEVNRHLVNTMHMASLNSLPTPLDNNSANTSIPNNRYGIAAAVIGGFVKTAASYQPGTATPALAGTEQLARDLTDGNINGFTLDGSPAAPGSGILYEATQLPPSLDRGSADISKQFGSDSTYLMGPNLLDFGNVAVFRSSNAAPELFDQYSLLKDGSISVKRTIYSSAPTSDGQLNMTSMELPVIENFLQNVKQVAINQSYVLLSTGFAVKTDGSVWGWGNNTCGMLGTGEASTGHVKSPVKVKGLSDITTVAVGRWFALARNKNGEVYSWGITENGAAGAGEQARDASACDPVSGALGKAGGYAADLTPKKIPSLKNIVNIAIGFLTSYAIDDKGTLYAWDSTGRSNTPPREIKTVSPAISISFVQDTTLFLKADGTVWAEGGNFSGGAGDGTRTPKTVPTQISSLSDIVEISGDAGFTAFALRRDGSVFYWDNSKVSPFSNDLNKPQLIPASANLPKIRHIAKGRYLYGVDNSIYVYQSFDGKFVRN